MAIRILMALITIYLLSVNAAFAQVLDRSFLREGPISIGTTVSLKSEGLSEERKILVSLPYDYDTGSERYPVVYITDPLLFYQFGYASGVIKSLSFIERIPQLILVGVHSEDRELDLTTEFSGRGGNAGKFIEFFREELQPFIEQKYRTQPYKTLIGHSAGGFFSLHTLLQAPDTFDAYVALDPSIWWDDGRLIDDLKEAQASGRRFDNTLFTSNIAFASDDRQYYREFTEALSMETPPGLTFRHKSFPDETHASTIIPGIYEALQAVYEDWPVPPSIGSLEALLDHYRQLSEHYGYTVEIPLTQASDAGFRLVNRGDAEGALEIFEYTLANISQNEIAHYQVAFALRELGRLEEALAAFDKAIEVGPESHMFDVFLRFRDEVQEELNRRDAVE